MNKEEMVFIEQQQREMDLAQAKAQTMQTNQANQAMMIQEENKSMVKEQLDLADELETIEHLLKGDKLQKNTDGVTEWIAPTNKDMIILSEHGIQLIMNTITFYINKNTLLSNYNEETIDQKMEDFASDLADTIFMEYEKVFEYPTFEDCKEILMQRIDKKTELRKFALELLGKEADTKSIKKELINNLEGKIEGEIQKIREQIIKNKLKRFLILIREVQDSIHSTYLRALNGQERKTLRQHIHISESRGASVPQPNPTKLNPLNWIGRSRV